MKNKAIKFFLAVLITSVHSTSAQNCEGYFPSKKGTVLEMTMFNDKDKKQGTSMVTIQDVNTSGAKSVYKLHAEMKDAKDKTTSQSDYEATCENNSFYMSMKSMIPPDQMKSMENMEVSIKADDIQYPADPKPGDKLPDAHLTISTSMSGMKMPESTIDITERTVVGPETITTPAGTFDCIKITSKARFKNIIAFEAQTAEWIAKGVGVVKTQSFKGDKIKSYSLLTAVR